MSSLNDAEKRYLERVLEMGSGWVLDYNDMTYGQLFNRYGVDIHGKKYQIYGTSKAKKMRAFWEIEPDILVGKVLSEMLDVHEANCKLNSKEVDTVILQESRKIVLRLLGVQQHDSVVKSDDDFLKREFMIPNIQKLPIEDTAVPIIEGCLIEVQKTLVAGAYLSVVFLCGSVLEAVLLGAAQKDPARFNRAMSSPKSSEGKVRQLHEWSLSQFIDVASEIELLKPDVKKFSHGLRHFRNYIHPYEQLLSGFTPDEHTAKLCFQVLKAALASVAGER